MISVNNLDSLRFFQLVNMAEPQGIDMQHNYNKLRVTVFTNHHQQLQKIAYSDTHRDGCYRH